MRPLAVILCALCATSALAQTRAAIQAQYDRFAKAYVKNDAKTLLSILAPDFVLINGEGVKISYRQYARQLREREKKGVPGSAYEVKIKSLQVKGSRATVLTNEVSVSKNGEEHVHTYRDVWKKIKGQWRLASSTTLSHG